VATMSAPGSAGRRDRHQGVRQPVPNEQIRADQRSPLLPAYGTLWLIRTSGTRDERSEGSHETQMPHLTVSSIGLIVGRSERGAELGCGSLSSPEMEV
jgi:hypothetical protein